MATPKEIVDGALGDGWYDGWRDLEADVEREAREARLNEARFSSFRAPGTTDNLWWDLRLLEAVGADYRAAMSSIAQGRAADADRVGRIHDALTLALGVVHHDNEALGAAFAAGIVTGFVAVPFAILQLRAKRLEEALDVLKARLEAAKRERNEAWVQGAIGTSLTMIAAFMPHVGILTRGGIAVGQWFLDDALGPSTSRAASAGSKAGHVASQIGDAVAEIEGLGRRTRTFAKGSGRVATVAGFAFDANEIMAGHRNVGTIEEAMSRGKRAYSALVAEIVKHKPTLQRFLMDYRRWQAAIRSVRETASGVRDALTDELRRTGYRPSR